MRIGWVIPWVHGVGGNKTVFSLCRELSNQGHDVELLCHTAQREHIPEVRNAIGGAALTVSFGNDARYTGPWSDLKWQVSRHRDRQLAEAVYRSHLRRSFDFVILVGNEGKRFGQELRRILGEQCPLLGISVMELIDHSYLLRRERPHAYARLLLAPLYPAVHWAWAKYLESYDFLCANSIWTSEICEYLYGARCSHILISIPEEAYQTYGGLGDRRPESYVAVPTVSIGASEELLLKELRSLELPLLSYGPVGLPGIEHLGYLSEQRMREVVRNAACTLFLFDYEGLGLIPFESLALGTPVVTLPKLAVLRQWEGNRFVDFQSSIPGIAATCRRWIERPPTPSDRKEAVQSVDFYRASLAARRLIEFLETLRIRPAMQRAQKTRAVRT